MAEKLKYIRNSWAAFNKGSLIKTTARRGEGGAGAGRGGKVLHQLFSLMCMVCYKGRWRWWLVGGGGRYRRASSLMD